MDVRQSRLQELFRRIPETTSRLFNRHFVRSLEGQNLLEVFFVTAVASVLGIRFFLALTGYPKLSPGNLHIAHVLLGGILMMLALVIALGYINKSAYYVAAALGGFGFGAFIDELGKFITGDNNYFYRPTAALIYIIFVLIYLGIQAFVHKPRLTKEEKLINALEIAKEVVLEDLDHRERKRALELLKGCSPNDPVTKALRGLLYATDAVSVPRPDIYTAMKYRARRLYRKMVQREWFVMAMIGFFLLQSFLALGIDFFLLYERIGWRLHTQGTFLALPRSDLAGLVSATVAASFAMAGIMKMRSCRLEAYELFKNAVLVQIFLVQVFLFYKAQFIALFGLAANICVLLVLYYMIRQEKAAQGICQENDDLKLR
jgi:hypothetical protein